MISEPRTVINLQEKPGPFFSVIQIGINAVAILGGIVGEAAFTDVFAGLFKWFVPAQYLETTSFFVFIPSDHDVVHYLC